MQQEKDEKTQGAVEGLSALSRSLTTKLSALAESLLLSTAACAASYVLTRVCSLMRTRDGSCDVPRHSARSSPLARTPRKTRAKTRGRPASETRC